MNDFIKNYGSNITFIVVILGFIVTIIVQWDTISNRMTKLFKTFDRVPLFLFKLVAIAVSGTVICSVYWILTEFLAFGWSVDIVGIVISGAAWGIPPAIVASRAKNIEVALNLSILTGIIILLLATPNQIFPLQEINRADALILLWFASSTGIASGYVGYKTRCFLDTVSPKQEIK